MVGNFHFLLGKALFGGCSVNDGIEPAMADDDEPQNCDVQ